MTKKLDVHSHKDELKEKDLRVTSARVAVMDLLESTDKPVDVANIKEYLIVKKIYADDTTLFRIINMFTQRGITKQVSFNEGKFRYELANQKDHHHLICENCGSIEDVSDCAIPELENDIWKKRQFLVKSHSLEFFGLCKNCQKKRN